MINMDEFVENEDAKESLGKFITSSQSCLLVIGPSGSGKTSLCQIAIAAADKKFQVMRPVYEDFATHKEFADHLKKFISMRNMLEIFENRPKILFLDDLDTLISHDRFANMYVQQLITSTASLGIKILMTCTTGQEKRVADIKKKVLWTKIFNPSVSAAILYMRKMHPLETDKVSHDQLEKYVLSLQCNVRACKSNLHILKDGNTIKEELANRIVFDKNICDSVEAIFAAGPMDAKTLDICLSEDPSLISYIMYDNFSKFAIHTANHEIPSVYDRTVKVIDAYTLGAMMENIIFAKNDWLLHDICNLYRCGILKYLIGQGQYKKCASITYTTITTRASNYYNMIKRVGEHQATSCASFAAIQRYCEIQNGRNTIKSHSLGRRHKEDSGLNNYIKRIFNPKRNISIP